MIMQSTINTNKSLLYTLLNEPLTFFGGLGLILRETQRLDGDPYPLGLVLEQRTAADRVSAG